MITTNETGKVKKLTLDIPEPETSDLFHLVNNRLTLSRLSPLQKPQRARHLSYSSSVFKSFSTVHTCTSMIHKTPFIFSANSNDLNEKGCQNDSNEADCFLAKEEFNKIYKDHLIQTYSSLKIANELQAADLKQLRSKRVTISKRLGFEQKKTVVFDLDETLIHSCQHFSADADVVLRVKSPSGESLSVSVCVRPFAVECLRKISEEFEVIVFTAAYQHYADAILDYLDPGKEMIHHRFYRQHCLLMNGVFVKDLRIFANRKIKDIVMVDNLAHSFAFQIDNGIPIIPWEGFKNDIELHGLIYYLIQLKDAEDVRENIRESFRLREFLEEYEKGCLV